MIPSHARSTLRLRPTFRLATLLLATAMLAGCGGSDDDGDGGGNTDPSDDELCGLSASVSGGHTASRDFDACAGFGLYGDTLSVSFGAFESDWNMGFDIGPVTVGETATAVPAIVRVSLTGDSSGTSWETEEGSCTVDLTRFEAGEDDFFGPGYHVAGEGRCSGPARPLESEQAAEDVTIAPFEIFFFATTE